MRKDGAMFWKTYLLDPNFSPSFPFLPLPRPHLSPLPTFPPSPPFPLPSNKSTRGIKSEGEETVLKEAFVQHRNFASYLYHL